MSPGAEGSRQKSIWSGKIGAARPLLRRGQGRHLSVRSASRLRFGEEGVSAQFDTDNGIKGYLDVLVGLGIIPDDNRRIVKRLEVEWRDGDGADVTISEYEGREK